jgi:hypothetical protein
MSTPIGASTQTVPSNAPSQVAHSAPSSSQGLSNVPATITCQNQGREEGGFCQWISRMIDGFLNCIKSFLGFGPANSAVSSAIENTETSAASSLGNAEIGLNNRIQMGTEVIRSQCQFNGPNFGSLSATRFVAVTVLRYNNQVVASFDSLTRDQQNFEEVAIGQLCQLLSCDANRNCEDGILSIQTMVFQKDGDTSFRYISNSNSIGYPAGVVSSIGGAASRLDTFNIVSILARYVPDSWQIQRGIMNLIDNL